MKRVRSTSRNQADLCLAAAVIVLFCKQYDIIKDNDSNNHSKEKSKPLSGQSTPDYHNGGLLGSKVRPSPLITMSTLFIHSASIYQIKLFCIFTLVYENMSSLLVAWSNDKSKLCVKNHISYYFWLICHESL